MAMELVLTGMCEGCTCGDFTVSNEQLFVSPSANQYILETNNVTCSHSQACKRVREKTHKDHLKEINEIVDYLVDYGQHDHQFKLGETIKYSPSEVRHILLDYYGIEEDE